MANQRLLDAALVALLALLRDEVDASQRAAYLLGTTQAERELGRDALMDNEGLVFISQFEFDAIRTTATLTNEEARLIFTEAIQKGWGAAVTARELRRHVEAKEHLVRATARTEMNRAANWGRYTAWQRSGVVREKQYMATIDDRVRAGHLAADGNTVPMDQAFTAGDAAGYFMPPIAPNCRCTAIPITRLSEALGPSPVFEERQARVETLRREMDLTAGPEHVCLGEVIQDVIPGLRGLEARHERRMLKAWRQYQDDLVGIAQDKDPVVSRLERVVVP